MSRPETTIFGSLSSKPASGARSLGDFSRTSNPPPEGGGEWDPSQDFARLIGYGYVSPSTRYIVTSFVSDALALDRAENTEGTMIQHWTFARGGAWRNPKPTGGPYVCEQCRLDACSGKDGAFTLQAVTTIELAPTDVCADCGARLLKERVGHPSSIGRTHP